MSCVRIIKKMITLFKENLFGYLTPYENDVYPITENLSHAECQRIISFFHFRIKKIIFMLRIFFIFLFVVYVLSICFLLITHKLDQFDTIDITTPIMIIHFSIISICIVIYNISIMAMVDSIRFCYSNIKKEGLKFELIRSAENRGYIKTVTPYESDGIHINYTNIYINLKVTSL